MANKDLPTAPPFPTSVAEFKELRAIKAERTLNDMVEDIHLSIYSDPKYRNYLRAVYDAHAVEGSLGADNIMAAMMIRDQAKEAGMKELAEEKLAVISMALGVVLRRYHSSRKERRNMLGDKIVPADDNGE
jgi:hypothetical protein